MSLLLWQASLANTDVLLCSVMKAHKWRPLSTNKPLMGFHMQLGHRVRRNQQFSGLSGPAF